MNVLVILGHPDRKSFNHAIAETCLKKLESLGHKVIFHDLYKEKSDPVLHSKEIPKEAGCGRIVRKHCNDLLKCDGIIIIHPNWWGQPRQF